MLSVLSVKSTGSNIRKTIYIKHFWRRFFTKPSGFPLAVAVKIHSPVEIVQFHLRRELKYHETPVFVTNRCRGR